MKKRLSILLLTLIMVLSLVSAAFAGGYPLDNTMVAVPARFKEVQATDDGIVGVTAGKKSAEILIYLPIKYSVTNKDIRKLAKLALQKTIDNSNYEFPIPLSTVRSNGRKVYYFGVSAFDNGVYAYSIIAMVPNNGHCIMVADVIATSREAGAFPFSKKDAKRLANTVAVG